MRNRSLFRLGATLLLVGLTDGFQAGALRVAPTSTARAVGATVLGLALVAFGGRRS